VGTGEKGALYMRSRARGSGTVRESCFSSKIDATRDSAQDARVEERRPMDLRSGTPELPNR